MTIQKQRVSELTNPITKEIIGLSPLHEASDVEAAVIAAKNAQKKWAAFPMEARIHQILKIRTYITKHADEIAETISRDNGKTRVDAYVTEVLPAAMAISYYCKHAKRFMADRKLGMGNVFFINKRSKVTRVPLGVIGVISPWNYPFAIAFSEVIMGLLAGNGVVLKTATETQMAGLALKKSIEAADLPKGLFSFVNVPGKVAGEAILGARIDKLFFTGSISVGKLLMEKAAKTLTPVCLELGGNDAMIVCSDADVGRAVSGAVWGGFANCGQSCAGVERIYVHEAIYDSFITQLRTRVESLRVGYDRNFDVDMGGMTTQKQLLSVRAHIDDAVSKGATVFAKSKIPRNTNLHNFMPATVLTDVDHSMDVMKNESFGPVVGVMKVSNIEQAIALANDSDLGLTGSVWSKDRKKAERFARRIRAGVVTINDHMMSHGLPETSWGGFKESGIGRSHGEIGFQEMTQPQMIVDDVFSFAKKNLWWHPYDESTYDGVRGVMSTLYGGAFSARLDGLSKVAKILPRMFRA
jgi:acyl-CoA reductase-like NAD-dependent aldehyde dehydrogenase